MDPSRRLPTKNAGRLRPRDGEGARGGVEIGQAVLETPLEVDIGEAVLEYPPPGVQIGQAEIDTEATLRALRQLQRSR